MAASSAAAPAARLVLHFDVNKTLILIDPAGGKTLRHVLNGIIADTAWGTVADAAGDEPPVWTAASDDLSIGRPPAADASTPLTGGRVTSDDGTNLCTYHHFVEEILLPFEPVAGLTGDAKAAAVKANKAIKARRNDVMLTFTDEGAPGYRYKAHFVKLMDNLTVPAAHREAAAAASPAFSLGLGPETPTLFMLGSYFELLKQLHKDGRDFAVVFRTFGDDIPLLVKEHNMYCRGEHPVFATSDKMDGSDGGVDRTVHLPVATGRFIRHADIPGVQGSGVHLATTIEEHGETVVDAVTGYHACMDVLSAKIREGHRTLAIKDHYPYWHTNGETAECGKILLVDPKEASEHHIFFDDNVGFANTGAEIVDVRDVGTGETLPYAAIINQYLVKAQPTEAALNATYFYDKVKECERNRAAALAAGSAGAGSA